MDRIVKPMVPQTTLDIIKEQKKRRDMLLEKERLKSGSQDP